MIHPILIPYLNSNRGDNEIGFRLVGEKPTSITFHYVFLSPDGQKRIRLSKPYPKAVVGERMRKYSTLPKDIEGFWKVDDIWLDLKIDFWALRTDCLWIVEGVYMNKVYAYAQTFVSVREKWESSDGKSYTTVVAGKKERRAKKLIERHIQAFHPELNWGSSESFMKDLEKEATQ